MRAGSVERASITASALAHLLVLGAVVALGHGTHAPHADVISVSLHAQADPGPAAGKVFAMRSPKPSIMRAAEPEAHLEPMMQRMALPETAAPASVEAPPDAGSPVEEAVLTGGGTAGPSAAGDGGVHDMVRERIRAMIQERVKYPALARKRGVEGTVIAGFSVGPEGRPASVRLIRSSGHALLDREVLRAVEKASPYPPAARAVEVPVTFRIE